MATWNDGVTLLSLLACVLGLVWLSWPIQPNSAPTGADPRRDEHDTTEDTLLRMSFAYWAVHCVAIGILRLWIPTGEIIVLSLKFTAILTYFLTAACILSLPLSRFASTQRVEE